MSDLKPTDYECCQSANSKSKDGIDAVRDVIIEHNVQQSLVAQVQRDTLVICLYRLRIIGRRAQLTSDSV